MIRFDNVAKRYPNGHEGLSGVDLHLEPGEMAFVTGHSGAGKSTLLKLIGLLERATRGQVWVNGRAVWRDGATTGVRPGRAVRLQELDGVSAESWC